MESGIAPDHRPDPRPRGPAGRAPSGPAGRRPGGAAATAPRRPSDPPAEPVRLRELVAGFAQAFLEVEAGRRPRRQLDPLLCPLLAARLADVWVRDRTLGTVVAVRGTLVEPDRYEAVVVVRRGRRCGAVAVVLGRHGRAWRVVDAARPEDGVLPQPPAWCPWGQEAQADEVRDDEADAPCLDTTSVRSTASTRSPSLR